MNIIGYINETLGNIIEMLKIISHHQILQLLLYITAEQLSSCFGRFLYSAGSGIYVSLITWALGICLIYMPALSGLRPLGLGIYIRQIPHAHVLTI